MSMERFKNLVSNIENGCDSGVIIDIGDTWELKKYTEKDNDKNIKYILIKEVSNNMIGYITESCMLKDNPKNKYTSEAVFRLTYRKSSNYNAGDDLENY